MEKVKASKVFGLAIVASVGWHIGKYVSAIGDSTFLRIIKRANPDVYESAMKGVTK